MQAGGYCAFLGEGVLRLRAIKREAVLVDATMDILQSMGGAQKRIACCGLDHRLKAVLKRNAQVLHRLT